MSRSGHHRKTSSSGIESAAQAGRVLPATMKAKHTAVSGIISNRYRPEERMTSLFDGTGGRVISQRARRAKNPAKLAVNCG